MFPCTDAFVIKLDPAGNVLFATYFGGDGNETGASAICVDASGNVYLGGTTGPNTCQSAGYISGYARRGIHQPVRWRVRR